LLKRTNIFSDSPWERKAGYARAVRIGNTVEVSGTTAFEAGKVVAPGDAYQQASCILKKLETALAGAGAAMSDVVRTRMYLTDIADWEAVTRAHGECFGEIYPAGRYPRGGQSPHSSRNGGGNGSDRDCSGKG